MVTEDNGPVIVGVTWFLCFFCGGFLALRLYAKISRRQGLWWDDYILIFSWNMLLIETILTQIGQRLGFGKHTVDIPPQNLSTIALGASVSASISCFASTFSKISFGVTLLRLTCGRTKAVVWFCIITLFIVILPSALLTWISCRPMAKAWNSTIQGHCWDGRVTVWYGIFNAAWCSMADFVLALLPWKLVWALNLNVREKIGIGIAMSMGLLAGICAIVKGAYLMQLAEQDFFFNGKDVTIWTAVETATAIVGASIPVLRVFFKATMASLNHRSGIPGRSVPATKSISVPLSTFRRSTSHTASRATVDNTSERSILGSEDDAGVVIEEGWPNRLRYGEILRTHTITVISEREEEDDERYLECRVGTESSLRLRPDVITVIK